MPQPFNGPGYQPENEAESVRQLEEKLVKKVVWESRLAPALLDGTASMAMSTFEEVRIHSARWCHIAHLKHSQEPNALNTPKAVAGENSHGNSRTRREIH